MVCVYCSGHTSVVNSRHQKKTNQVWRRRKCQVCLAVFTTLEMVETTQALRVRTQGHFEPFSRDTLLLSIYDSLRHRKTAVSDATALTTTVMSQLYSLVQDATVDTASIIEVAAAVLDRFDAVAATHYRAFHPAK